MAAGHQKKGLTNSNLLEQNSKKKKKKLDFPDHVLNLRSQVHLEWDDRMKMAVSRRAQIGITWKDLSPFVDCPPHYPSDLADVLTVPQEIFDLQDLRGVLSYEVWAICLSESERKLLTQFLPVGTSAEHSVHSLLVGQNLHFGNPFIEWSTSLCSGDLHPDNVLQTEKQSVAYKRAYYAHLRCYHIDLLEILKQWKERWLNCLDPKELWSCSRATAIQKHKAHFSRKDDIHESYIDENTTAKYMSYIKISKKQLEFVKSLNQSGDGIQLKSLGCVLGDIKSYQVEQYTKFEEEEKKRLNEHWLRVAKFDVQFAFDGWRRRNFLREEWGKALKLELEKRKSELYKSNNTSDLEISRGESHSNHEEHTDSEKSEHNSDVEMLEQEPDSVPKSMGDHQELKNGPESNQNNHFSDGIPSLNYHQQLKIPNSLPDLEFDCQNLDQVSVKPMQNSPDFAHFFGKSELEEDILDPKMRSSSTKEEMWLSVGQQGSFYNDSIDFHLGKPLEGEALDPEGRENNELPFNPFTPISYSRGANQPGLQFLTGSDGFFDSLRSVKEFTEPQCEVSDQAMNGDCSSERYPIQGNYPSTDPPCFPTISSSSSSSLCDGALTSQNWLFEKHRPLNSWRVGFGIESSGVGLRQCLEYGSGADGGLFGVQPECRILPPRPDFENTGPRGQFFQETGFVGDGMLTHNGLVYGSVAASHHQFKGATSSSEPSSSNRISLNNLQWKNFSCENPRPWNR